MQIKFVFLILFVYLLSSCKNTDHPKIQGYVEGENIYLSSPYSGILETLNVTRGQHVIKGELLYQLDPNPQKMNIFQAQGELEQAQNTLVDLEKPKRSPEIAAIQAQIEQAEAQITLWKIRVDRYQKLYNKNASDKDTLDAAIARLQGQQQLKLQYQENLALAQLGSRIDQINAQKEQVKALKAKLNAAQWELKQKTIFAPKSGVIFDTYYREGELVGSLQPVLSLLTPENIRIEFFIPLDFLAKVHVGQPISFDCVGCDPHNSAEISYISPDAEYIPPLVYSRENNSKLVFRIKAHITNPSQFKPGQPVMVTL